MFTKAQLNITQENSPCRDVGHIVHLQDQHSTAQFPVCIRKLKCLLKSEQFLIASHRIAFPFPFLLTCNSPPSFLKLSYQGLGFRSRQCFVVICHLSAFMRFPSCPCLSAEIQVPWAFLASACSHLAEESILFISIFSLNAFSTPLFRWWVLWSLYPHEDLCALIGCSIDLCLPFSQSTFPKCSLSSFTTFPPTFFLWRFEGNSSALGRTSYQERIQQLCLSIPWLWWNTCSGTSSKWSFYVVLSPCHFIPQKG